MTRDDMDALRALAEKAAAADYGTLRSGGSSIKHIMTMVATQKSFQDAMDPSVILTLLDAYAERDRLLSEIERKDAALRDMVSTFSAAGCHVCSGDCGSANPPVMGCPYRVIQDARAALAPVSP